MPAFPELTVEGISDLKQVVVIEAGVETFVAFIIGD